MEQFGLSENEIAKLCGMFGLFSNIEKVIIYGSRAKGNYTQFSDIDITLCGDAITKDDLSKLVFDIDYLLLPYNIDISIYNKITNPDLVSHIDRVGKVFYEKEKINV